MRRLALFLLWAGPALAQSAAPPVVPSVVPVQIEPPAAQQAPAAPPPDQPAPPWPNLWQPRPIGEIQALDKISAKVATLTLRIGEPQKFGTLTITLRSCYARPPDQPADSAAWLEASDSTPGQPGFRGWMFASAPSVSMLESPLYDLRLNACHG